MTLDVWFPEDVERIIRVVAIARNGLTSDERLILSAIAAGFGLQLDDILPQERRVIVQLPASWSVENEK